MKRIITLAMAALMVCSFAQAQDVAATRQTLRERKLIAKQSSKELNKKAGKDAVKAAKQLKKEGWSVAPGQLPLEKQLDKAYNMSYEFEESGLPKYILADAKSVGSAYDAAKMQALNNAKINLAGLIETEVTALTESTRANEEISADDAVSINKAVEAGKSLIAQKLSRVVPVVECYRTLPNKNVEVNVRIAYNAKMAIESAKEVIKSQLEAEGKDLHDELDRMWGNLEK